MIEVTDFDVQSKDRLFALMYQCYTENKGLTIPADLIKDFTEHSFFTFGNPIIFNS